MRRQDFHYDLPDALIAQEPLPSRTASRLLRLDGRDGTTRDARFADLPELLQPGDLLVFNDTRVLNARIHARKPTGGRVQMLLERTLDESRGLFQARASKAIRAGDVFALDGGAQATIVGRQDELYEIDFGVPLIDYLAQFGSVPLPPYIERPVRDADRERYQTVYARAPGAVAAPTAGLHFDRDLLANLEEQGIGQAFITLHVGAGTFQPVRADDIEAHCLHAERVEVNAAVCSAIANARARRGRVVAVGTTVVRALESACRGGKLQAFAGETTLFIRPGYRFNAVDLLLTNFHLPESTLLMLVCAFGGYETVMRAYRYAVERRYRFFSYGDAMLVHPDPAARVPGP
jgi:S-adenosylmethionine:tRNA ribosyltransferase-isomerase